MTTNNEQCQKSNLHNADYLDKEFYKDSYSKFKLQTDDIVLALNRPIVGNYLKISKVPKNLDNSLLYQRAGKIIFNVKNYINHIFAYYLISKEVFNFTKKEAVGSDQPFISTTKLKQWEIKISNNIEEQQKMEQFFCKI